MSDKEIKVADNVDCWWCWYLCCLHFSLSRCWRYGL